MTDSDFKRLSSRLNKISVLTDHALESPETAQLKITNEMSKSIVLELQKSNNRISSLETELKQIKDSHKHDFLKQIILGIFCAILGSVATVIIERLIGL